MGAPFPVRRIAVPIMGRSTDIVKQVGDIQVVTTINAKGAWTRKFIVGKEVKQKNAEGDDTVAVAWWETDDGKVMHKSKLEGGKRGISESWRWFEDCLMVIKSIVHLKNGKMAWMLWYFERIEPVQNENYLSARKKLKQITKEQKLISQITAKQTEEVASALKEMTYAQQIFISEMLQKVGGKKAAPAVAKAWQIKAKNAPGTSSEPSADEEDTFYDCDESTLTKSQKAQVDKQVGLMESKLMKFSLAENPNSGDDDKLITTTWLCFPIKQAKKRLPTIVRESLADSFKVTH
mmetsp:Transcript_14075/g.35575  ORF Transcript_14075/g.35575 Transcript_14075/m.35575 type:complete len:292 (+) Transcript_14075:119-994(+)